MRIPRVPRWATALVALSTATALALALPGCTATAESATPTPTPGPSSSALLYPELSPQTIIGITEESTAAEAVRIADSLATLLDPAAIVSLTDESRLVPADDDIAAYYVVYRTYVLDPSIDPMTLAETLGGVLSRSGWAVHGSTTEQNLVIVALAAGSGEQSWFVFLQGDETVAGEPALSIQLAAPDL